MQDGVHIHMGPFSRLNYEAATKVNSIPVFDSTGQERRHMNHISTKHVKIEMSSNCPF